MIFYAPYKALTQSLSPALTIALTLSRVPCIVRVQVRP